MAQQLGALAPFAEDSGLAPSTHVMPSQPSLAPAPRDPPPLLTSTDTRDALGALYVQAKHLYMK